MPKLLKWKPISGKELDATLSLNQSLDSVVESCQAIYIWRRAITVSGNTTASQGALFEFICSATCKPFAKIENKTLTHYARLDELTLSGEGLSQNKKKTLNWFLRKTDEREFLSQFLNSLSNFAVPIYVGETNDLQRRIKDHWTGITGLKDLLEMLNLKWSDITLYYWWMGPKKSDEDDLERAKERRTLFEMMTSHLVFASGVKRVG